MGNRNGCDDGRADQAGAIGGLLRHFCGGGPPKALVVQVAPALEAHMIAAQNLEKKLAGR